MLESGVAEGHLAAGEMAVGKTAAVEGGSSEIEVVAAPIRRGSRFQTSRDDPDDGVANLPLFVSVTVGCRRFGPRVAVADERPDPRLARWGAVVFVAAPGSGGGM